MRPPALLRARASYSSPTPAGSGVRPLSRARDLPARPSASRSGKRRAPTSEVADSSPERPSKRLATQAKEDASLESAPPRTSWPP